MADKQTVIKIEYDVDEAQKNLDELALKIDGLKETNKQFQKAVNEARKDLKKTDTQLQAEGKTRENLIKTIQDGTVKISRNKDALKSANSERSTAIKQITGEKSAFDKLTEAVSESTKEQKKQTSVLAGMGDKMEAMPGSLGAITTGFKGTTKAAKAFLMNPIGAVLAAIVGSITLLIKGLKRTEAGSNKLNKVMAVLKGVLNAVMKIVGKVANAMMDAFTNPQQAVKDLWEAIKKNIVNRFTGLMDSFKALGKVIQAAFKFNWDEVKNQSKILGESVMQTLTGVDDLAGKLKDGFKELASEIKNTTKATVALASEEAKLQEMQRNAQLIQLEYQKNAEKLRQIRDDESKSIEERITANEELGKVLKEQMTEELKIANQALKVANLRIATEGASTENLDARAEALTNIADIQERITGQESEQLVNINSLLKEQADIEAEASAKRKEAADEEAKRRGEAIAKLAELKQQELEAEASSLDELRKLKIEKANEEFEAMMENDLLLQEEKELAEAEHKARLKAIDQEYYDNKASLEENAKEDAVNAMKEIIDATSDMGDSRVTIITQSFNDIAALDLKELKSSQDKYNAIGQLAMGLSSLVIGNYDAELSALDAQLEAELALVGDNEGMKANITARYNKKANELKKKQFEDDKKKALIDAAIATALAIMAGLNTAPLVPLGLIMAGVAGVLGGVQIAAIAKQHYTPTATYAKGGVIGGKPHSQGGTKFYGEDGSKFEAEKGEAMFILKKDATAEIAALSMLNESHGGRSFFGKPSKHLAEGGIPDTASIDDAVESSLRKATFMVNVGSIETGITNYNKVKNVGVI